MRAVCLAACCPCWCPQKLFGLPFVPHLTSSLWLGKRTFRVVCRSPWGRTQDLTSQCSMCGVWVQVWLLQEYAVGLQSSGSRKDGQASRMPQKTLLGRPVVLLECCVPGSESEAQAAALLRHVHEGGQNSWAPLTTLPFPPGSHALQPGRLWVGCRHAGAELRAFTSASITGTFIGSRTRT